MNKRRRTALQHILDNLAKLKNPIDKDAAIELLKSAQDETEVCMDEEQDALDSRPESLQWSTMNDDMTENVSDLSDAAGDLSVLIEQCQNMESFNYESIENDIVEIVNQIKQVIHR